MIADVLQCRAWYKRGDVDGKVVALWPGRESYPDSVGLDLTTCIGSNINELRALEQPRWEDFEYTFVDENQSQNKLYWLGNGATQAEIEGKRGTRAWYVTRPPKAKI